MLSAAVRIAQTILTAESKHPYPCPISFRPTKSLSALWMVGLRGSSALRCSLFAQHDKGLGSSLTNFLPDSAGVGSDHLLSGFAAEGLVEFRHIRHHVVDAENRQRMRVCGHNHAGDLGTDVSAPGIGIGEEETRAVGR